MERLQKYMARCGIASRRKCEEYIQSGKVKVNGVIISELGTKVDTADIVVYNGKKIVPCEKKVYIALNKPTGVITSVTDDRGRKTVIDIIDVEERIFPIGRLDYDTSGLLLLTNDGDIYNNIIHPRVEINKVYEAIVKGSFTPSEIESFENGVDIGGYITAKSKIDVVEKYNNKSKVRIVIHEGKNRQVRKMCKAFNHEVISLRRVSIGKIKLDTKIGEWRYLTEKEIKYLHELGDEIV